MSLDVYLEIPRETRAATEPRIYVRENGRTQEISRAEWDVRYPGREPVAVAGDDEESDTTTVYSGNITHNLGTMAGAGGLYLPLWRPEELNITKAAQLIPLLRDGLALLNSEPERFLPHNPENGWGNYEGLCEFVAEYLRACERWPDANVRAWR